MYRGFALSLALGVAFSAGACGGRASADGADEMSGASSGSASGASAMTSSGVSGAASGTTAGIVSGGSGTAAESATAGLGAGAGSGASSGMGYAPCGVGASTEPVSFVNQIMPILQSNCSVGGTGSAALCHGAPWVAAELTPGGSRQWFGPPTPAVTAVTTLEIIYNGFVGQPSAEDLTMDAVTPGDPTQSFLWYKINDTQGSLDMEDQCARGDFGSCGLQMPYPLSGSDSGPLLAQMDRALICNWIVQGAPISPCPAGQGLIENGICAPCPSGEVLCGGLCVDEQTDLSNCGACGHVCPNAEFEASCQNGACAPCFEGEVLCAYPGGCTSLQGDSFNCGTCGFRCPGLTVCQDGSCIRE
jgi:hypothetical protein